MRLQYGDWTISSFNVGAKESRYGSDASQHHKIYVQYNGSKAVFFDYWASRVEPHINSKKQLLEAFSVILIEAQDGRNLGSIDDFVAEFGYDYKTTKVSEILDLYDAIQNNFIRIDHIVDGDWSAVERAYERLSEEGYA